MGGTGSVGFDFPPQPPLPFVGDPNDLNAAENGKFFVVRTNSTTWAKIGSTISGGFTGLDVSTFAPIPEPSSVLFGLAMFGVTVVGRSRRAKSV